MTTIKITHKNNAINYISISGHADFKKLGKDIVCSSISTLTFYTMNALEYFKKDRFVKSNINDQENIIEFRTVEVEETSQKLLELLVAHLSQLSNQYNENIKIEEK